MKHILIVDDDNMNCMIAKHALGKEYHVTAVNSGAEAIAFLEKETVDLILMDIEMPHMNGKDAARLIKNQEKHANTPMIFLTADTDPATEIECLEWGADDYITKPFVPTIMNSRVGRILELYELRKDLESQLAKKTQQMEMATQKSLTDALTGLHNRDYLQRRMEELLTEGIRGAMFMIDLDNFKTMNDTYGHILGDKTLQIFAEVLKTYARDSDIVCRLAGDEFVTFYSNFTDSEKVSLKAADIIRNFAERMGALGYPDIVSVSIGIVITEGKEAFGELYNMADKSLYFVKNNGKNAYHIYGEHREEPEEISTIVDLDVIKRLMEEGVETNKGAFHVAYDEFKHVYDFIARYAERKQKQLQLVLFTLEWVGNVGLSVEEVMRELEQAIISSLRSMDAGTKYSNKQYIVILMDASLENGKLVAERVIQRFYDHTQIQRGEIKLTYDIQTRASGKPDAENK